MSCFCCEWSIADHTLQIGGEQNPLKYAHFIQLVANGPGQYYIHNEIFRLNYA